MAAPEERFLSTEEIAERLQVDEQTVRRWIKSGKLEAFKPGREWRVAPAALDAFLEDRGSPKGPASPSLDKAGAPGEERRVTPINVFQLEHLLESAVGEKILAQMEQTTTLLRVFEAERGRLPVDVAEFRDWLNGLNARATADEAQAPLSVQEHQATPEPTTPVEAFFEELEQRFAKVIAGEALPGAEDSLSLARLGEEVPKTLRKFADEGLIRLEGPELIDHLDRAFDLGMRAENFLEARKNFLTARRRAEAEELRETEEALRGVRGMQKLLEQWQSETG